MADLPVADKLLIEVHIQTGIHAFKVQQVTFAVVLFQLKNATINAARIVNRHIRRIKRERVVDIGVMMVIKAVVLPI